MLLAIVMLLAILYLLGYTLKIEKRVDTYFHWTESKDYLRLKDLGLVWDGKSVLTEICLIRQSLCCASIAFKIINYQWYNNYF